MSKLIYSMGVSLDGYIAGPDADGEWAAPDQELHRFHNEQARERSLQVFGSSPLRGHGLLGDADEPNPSPPGDQLEFARIWKGLPEPVFSKTLQTVEGNTRLSHGDPVGAVREGPGRCRRRWRQGVPAISARRTADLSRVPGTRCARPRG